MLLAPDEPSPVTVERPQGASPFFLACEHAGKRIPRRLGNLGLDDYHLGRHIAWDIGAEAVALGLSERLDATLVSQAYSRLVIDCNRDPLVETSIVTVSEATRIPGNHGIPAAEANSGPTRFSIPTRTAWRPSSTAVTLRAVPAC